MNRKTKGIVAGAAGAAILLGTAGTFALWSDTDTVGGATVTGGTFALSAEDIAWEDYSIATGAALDDTADNEITLVPGVKLVGTAEIDADLVGDYLAAELLGNGGASPAPNWLEVKWAMDGGTPVAAGESQFAVLTPADVDTETHTVSVEIQLANQAPAGGPSQVAGQTWTSGDFTVTLKQLAPTAP